VARIPHRRALTPRAPRRLWTPPAGSSAPDGFLRLLWPSSEGEPQKAQRASSAVRALRGVYRRRERAGRRRLRRRARAAGFRIAPPHGAWRSRRRSAEPSPPRFFPSPRRVAVSNSDTPKPSKIQCTTPKTIYPITPQLFMVLRSSPQTCSGIRGVTPRHSTRVAFELHYDWAISQWRPLGFNLNTSFLVFYGTIRQLQTSGVAFRSTRLPSSSAYRPSVGVLNRFHSTARWPKKDYVFLRYYPAMTNDEPELNLCRLGTRLA
jgi:hypothetical protein